MEEIKRYNFNSDYINTLIKKNKYTDKDKLCKRLYLTRNALGLKLSERSLIYINEGIIIADELKMNILDIFCPTDQQLLNILYNKKNIDEIEYKYNEFNINQKYIKELMKLKNITISDLCDIWKLKTVSIYDKLRGDTKITVKEGINFALLIDISVNELFCPTEIHMKQIIAKILMKENKKEKENDVVIIKNYNNILNNFTMNNINYDKIYIKSLLFDRDKKIKDLANIWDVSIPQAYNKIYGIVSIEFSEALKLSEFLKLPFKTIFNPTKKQIEEAKRKYEN